MAAAVAVIAAVGVAVGRQSDSGTPGITGNSPSTSLPADAATVAAKVDPGVVDITTRLGYESGEAAGTGMVLTSSGYVLTNNHVVDGATSITVTDVGNGQTYSATVVGTDASADVAVIKLQGASGLRTVHLGNSSSLSVGQALTAIGNAGGVGGTPSVAGGSITALDQSITATDESDQSTEQLSGLIQTDATLQPGDSGGPLVNAKGLVVGMDTAASTGFEFQSGQSEGFSIPINEADAIAKQMMAGQSSGTIHIGPAALIGVDVEPPQLGSGALVVEVQPGTPADDAGLVPGDTITSLGGQTVSSPTSLRSLMSRHHPGDKVQIGWVDESGASHTATITLVSGPAQ
ncbi:MAG TPA: trypsin-like peptidase domain-containing protein [Acidimicrobiales bacterium]|nr:trypsin-like peptidase domain-containing protein [Acidimicrobiales bacterium]